MATAIVQWVLSHSLPFKANYTAVNFMDTVMTVSIGHRLEQYTLKHPEEVLLVAFETDGKPDQVAIFKGFSSSLMCPTAFDPDVPVIPDQVEIQHIDRLKSPYNPNDPCYIQRHLSWDQFQPLLKQLD
jgi:hypothetical protein